MGGRTGSGETRRLRPPDPERDLRARKSAPVARAAQKARATHPACGAGVFVEGATPAPGREGQTAAMSNTTASQTNGARVDPPLFIHWIGDDVAVMT